MPSRLIATIAGRSLVTLLAACCWTSSISAQRGGLERVPLRITSVQGAKRLVVDRGSRDRLQTGDRIVFYPRNGTSFRGRIVRSNERSSVVEILDVGVRPRAGVRGEAVIPRGRTVSKAKKPEKAGDAKKPAPKAGDGPDKAANKAESNKDESNKSVKQGADNGKAKSEGDPQPVDPKRAPSGQQAGDRSKRVRSPILDPNRQAGTRLDGSQPELRKDPPPANRSDARRWRNQDRGWRPGQPLLSGARPIRPHERATKMTGRFWTRAAVTQSSPSGFDSSFLRTGAQVDWENPFGRGGEAHVDVELDYLTDHGGDRGLDLLTRRLSYSFGGTRFELNRWEAGRFLQHGVPELGVLDGAEWSHRRASGDRFGVSAGFMPEPNDEHKSFDDFQFAAYYIWTADKSERTTITTAFQKTLHHSDFDRDLLLLKYQRLPEEGWDLNATFWVDFYSESDRAKPFIELTQAYVSATRYFDNGGGLDVSWRHSQWPQIERFEFLQVNANQLGDDRYDMLSVRSWLPSGEESRIRAVLSGWNDEHGNAGSFELGFDMAGALTEDGRVDLSFVANTSQHVSLLGARLLVDGRLEDGRWEAFYEFGNHHLQGFPQDRDDAVQHRFGGELQFWSISGFDVAVRGESWIWDEDSAWSIALRLERRL